MCVVWSYFKRLLDTMSRFLYIEHAYKNLALWMKNGSEPVQKLKRYIHRNLALPAKMIHESIDQPRRSTGIPHGVCTPLHRRLVDLLFRHPQTWCVNKHSFTTTYSHSHSYTTGYFIMSAKTSKEFRNIPVGKVSVYMHVIQRWR